MNYDAATAEPIQKMELTADAAFVLALCDDNEDARRLIRDTWAFVEVYDDAIDGQKNETDATIHRAFEWALFDLHRNGFYRAHPELEAALRLMVINWRCANELEASGGREDLMHSYVLRCSPYDFFVAVVLAAAGPDAALRAAERLRVHTSSVDSFDAYLAEHGKGE